MEPQTCAIGELALDVRVLLRIGIQWGVSEWGSLELCFRKDQSVTRKFAYILFRYGYTTHSLMNTDWIRHWEYKNASDSACTSKILAVYSGPLNPLSWELLTCKCRNYRLRELSNSLKGTQLVTIEPFSVGSRLSKSCCPCTMKQSHRYQVYS